MTTTKHDRLELARQIANGTRCYDCGSTIPGHHTELCEMAGDGDKLDLPAHDRTGHWTGERPES